MIEWFKRWWFLETAEQMATRQLEDASVGALHARAMAEYYSAVADGYEVTVARLARQERNKPNPDAGYTWTPAQPPQVFNCRSVVRPAAEPATVAEMHLMGLSKMDIAQIRALKPDELEQLKRIHGL